MNACEASMPFSRLAPEKVILLRGITKTTALNISERCSYQYLFEALAKRLMITNAYSEMSSTLCARSRG